MMKELQLDADAAWKQRYRIPHTWTEIAAENPRRGLASSNRTGVSQLMVSH